MNSETSIHDVPVPPTPERIAARCVVLSAVCCRAFIERDAGKPGAEQLRKDAISWLDRRGVSAELEQREKDLLTTPLGKLSREAMLDAMWCGEGMAVLGWVLHRVPLPAFHTECDPNEVADSIGFLAQQESTVLQKPHVRETTEISVYEETYLTLHWRLRQYSVEPQVLDFPAYVSSCKWGPLRREHVPLCEKDLSIEGVRIDRLENPRLLKILSVVQERHRAFNWLIGWEPIYSRVPSDT